MPKNGSQVGEVAYSDNYILLFLDNLDLDNYKISTNNAVSHCFARLPIPGTAVNVFFGRIKNFTNTYKFKPTLQSLNKLTIRITKKDGSSEVQIIFFNIHPKSPSQRNSINICYNISNSTTFI